MEREIDKEQLIEDAENMFYESGAYLELDSNLEAWVENYLEKYENAND